MVLPPKLTDIPEKEEKIEEIEPNLYNQRNTYRK
jgi:hypothetical protein